MSLVKVRMDQKVRPWKSVLRDRVGIVLALVTGLLLLAAYQRPDNFQLDLTSPWHAGLLEHWFPVENGPNGAYRWTSSPATLRLPAAAGAFQRTRVTVEVSAPRPEGAASPVPVEAWINGRLMQTWQLDNQISQQVIEGDPSLSGWSGAVNLTLRAPTFAPPADLRPLAVLVRGVRVETLPQGWQWPPLPISVYVMGVVITAYAWLRRLGYSPRVAAGLALLLLAVLGWLLFTARSAAAWLAVRIWAAQVVAWLLAELAAWRRGQAPDLPLLRFASALFLLAFVVRLALAHAPGDHDNFIAFKMMLENVTRHGVARAYDLDPVVGAYPPLHHYLLAAAGHGYRLLMSPDLDMSSPRLDLAMKLPTILLDMVTLLVIVRYAAAYTSSPRSRWIAAAYAFNPGIIYVVAFHGQLGDPLYTLGILVGVTGVLLNQGAIAGAGSAAGLLTKPQAAAFAPFLLIAGVRHLSPRRQIGQALLAGSVMAVVVLLPFALAGTLPDMLHTVSTTIGHGPRISSLAFNFWWLVGWGHVWSIKDTELAAGLIPYRTIGLFVYFVLAQGLIAVQTWRARGRAELALLAAFAGMAFFMLPTQIHENYLFPTFALLGLAMVHDRRAVWLTLILNITWGINLLTYDTRLLGPLAPASPEQISPLFPLQLAATLLNGVVFVVWIVWVLRVGRGERSTDQVARPNNAVQ